MKTSRFCKLIQVIWILALSSFSYAGEATLGAELELSSYPLSLAKENPTGFTPLELQTHARFMEKVLANCKIDDCTSVKLPPKPDKFNPPEYKITYPDGWWFIVSLDPGCVEIQTKPATLSQLKAQQARMENAIFKTGKKIGLSARPPEGNGHMNIGVATGFDNDPSKLMRFIADWENHPELSLGVLGDAAYNAPAMSLRTRKERRALLNLVNEVNSGQIKTTSELAKRIQNEAYLKHPLSRHPDWNYTEHYTGASVASIAHGPLDQARLELRSIYAQRSFADFILLGELLQGRIDYLERTHAPITYLERSGRSFTPQEKVNSFYKYVVEAGLPWEKFKVLIPPNLRRTKITAEIVRTENCTLEQLRALIR